METLVELFRNGKTIGSLIKMRPIKFEYVESVIYKLEHEVVASIFDIPFTEDGCALLKKLLAQAKVLYAKYDVMITNPPYIGTSSMESAVKDYAVKNYPNSKADMFAMFMETGFVKPNGFTAMINMHSWMFLTSYEKLRESILSKHTIISMAHLGPRGFDSISGEIVQTTTFVWRESYINGYLSTYCRLVAPSSEHDKEMLFLSKTRRYFVNKSQLEQISGFPFAYWASDKARNAYNNKNLDLIAQPRHGLATSDNDRFLKLWYEVDVNSASLHVRCDKSKKWFPMSKGGSFRKWYGNLEWVINYENDGKEIKDYAISIYKCSSRTIQNTQFYFQEGLTWSALASGGFSVRYQEKGALFGSGGYCAFTKPKIRNYILALLNSKATGAFIQFVSPTLNYEVGHIKTIPAVIDSNNHSNIDIIVNDNISISKNDWDSFETSWDFKIHPLIQKQALIADAFTAWEAECRQRFDTLKANEEELNRIFIEIYGLQDELTPEVDNKDVTVRLADKERDIKSLISYLVGVVMGRYSLDVPGLAYAGGEWDASKYQTYQPDDDGIVSIYSKVGMEDGLTARIIGLIKHIYGEDTYRQNMDFIAEALGKNNNESSEETLNRYLNDGFYADHLKVYQKRPIYWMFSSGKHGGFKCLIYMHRYTEDTLALINGKYFLPESTRLKNDMEELLSRISTAEGRDKIRLEKERQKLAAAYNEAIEYGQVLDHMANKYIAIDLDDGVKVNYAKFQGVELVTDSGTKVKKDLLIPIK